MGDLSFQQEQERMTEPALKTTGTEGPECWRFLSLDEIFLLEFYDHLGVDQWVISLTFGINK